MAATGTPETPDHDDTVNTDLSGTKVFKDVTNDPNYTPKVQNACGCTYHGTRRTYNPGCTVHNS